MSKSLASQVLPRAVLDSINRTIAPFVRLRANKDGVCSSKMRKERVLFYRLLVAELWQMDHRIRKLESLSGRHIELLMSFWFEKRICVGTLHTRLSMINTLLEWLDKPNLVKDISSYLPAEEVRRTSVAKESKARDSCGLDVKSIIDQAKLIDERLSLMLSLQHHLGLRVKESLELRPKPIRIMQNIYVNIVF